MCDTRPLLSDAYCILCVFLGLRLLYVVCCVLVLVCLVCCALYAVAVQYAVHVAHCVVLLLSVVCCMFYVFAVYC